MSYISNLEDHEIEALREYLTNDFREFSKFCFKILKGQKLLYVDYYVILFEVIQMLIDQRCTRLIINIPPRAGKTLFISIFLPLFAWVRNPSGESIITGFNSDVLAECAGYIRQIMTDPDFQIVFPDVVIDNNKKSVEKIGTMSAGVLHAIPPTGKMTGKGCGALVDGFAGIMAIDDVIKPDDANSPTERNKTNHRFSNTLLSRLATETTPLAIIMQRLNTDDLCGYLMKGGSHDTYLWLNIPGIITKETGSKEWYDKLIEQNGYTNVKPFIYSLPESEGREYVEREFEGKVQPVSSFWFLRKSVDTLLGLLNKDSYTFHSQYQGNPVNKGKVALSLEMLTYYNDYSSDDIAFTFVTADTACTAETYSDPTVAIHWGFTRDKKLILLDMIMGKWETPELIIEMRGYWRKLSKFNNLKPTMKPIGFYMEDKSSGLFLNQQFLKDSSVNVIPVARDGVKGNDKFSRFMNTIPYFEDGRILIPRSHEYTSYIVRELLGQSEYGSSTGNDDVVDNFSDAVVVVFANLSMQYDDWN